MQLPTFLFYFLEALEVLGSRELLLSTVVLLLLLL